MIDCSKPVKLTITGFRYGPNEYGRFIAWARVWGSGESVCLLGYTNDGETLAKKDQITAELTYKEDPQYGAQYEVQTYIKKTLTNVSAKESRFTPPSLEEVTRYKNERHSPVDPEAFIDFYQSKGWMVGKNKMKDWKAAFRNWERDRKPSSQGKKTAAEYNYEGYKALYEKEFGHDQRTDNEVLSISESDFHITET